MRGRSPSPSGSRLRRWRKGDHFAPLDPNGSEDGDSRGEKWGHWLCRAPSVSAAGSGSGSGCGSGSGYQKSDLRLLLGVLGAPLVPVHVSNNDPLPHLRIKDTPIVEKSVEEERLEKAGEEEKKSYSDSVQE